jgi:hypothetical protein
VQLDSRVTLLDALRDHLSLAGTWSARLDIAPPQAVAPLDELNVADGFLAFIPTPPPHRRSAIASQRSSGGPLDRTSAEPR